ncbi:MAG: ABC transporter permease [Planctomycetota bacterium]|nr:ABC transporter permease [Planctomycetota bacterium]
MLAFIGRRLLQSIPVFIGIILICFALLKLSGDPTNLIASPRASEAQRQKIREQLGIDKPWYVQLGRYLHGDLGKSYRHGRPALDMVLEGAAVTARLALGAMTLAVALGLLSGLLSAHKPRSLIDYTAATAASIGVSVPAFWLAMLLILIFAVKLEWLPLPRPESRELRYFVIPVVTLGLIYTALIARLTRGCLLEQMSQDYIRTARAKGVSRLQVLLGHAFPNALVPVVTVIGTEFAGLLTGAVLTETACALPGLGRVVFQAISERDHPVIIGGCLFFAFVFVIANLAVDMLYGWLDPRIRHRG